jgi:hypothetical protein
MPEWGMHMRRVTVVLVMVSLTDARVTEGSQDATRDEK